MRYTLGSEEAHIYIPILWYLVVKLVGPEPHAVMIDLTPHNEP